MAAGKVIIVTGASRGIGLAVTRHLLSRSARVLVVARTAAALEEIRLQDPERVRVAARDLADASVGKELVAEVVKVWGRLDGVVVNHGSLDPVRRIADASVEEWRRAYDLNVFSAVGLVQAALPELRKSQGKIIFTSSGAAVNGYIAWGAYGSGKAAINHLALTLANEEPEVTSIAVRPGVVDTEMQRAIREDHKSHMDADESVKFAHLHSSGGLLKPEQPGHVIAKLALDAPKSLNGKFLSWNDQSLSAFQE